MKELRRAGDGKEKIKIFRAGRESLEEAVRLVQSTEEKMKEKAGLWQKAWKNLTGG